MSSNFTIKNKIRKIRKIEMNERKALYVFLFLLFLIVLSIFELNKMCYCSRDLQEYFYLRLLIFGLLFLLFGLIGMLCMTAGYINNSNKNSQLVQGTCVTQSHAVIGKTCSYTCNCNDDICHTCYRPCYDGYINVNIQNIVTMAPIYIITLISSPYDVNNYLTTFYPISGEFRCYYSGSNETSVQVQINLNDANSSFIAGLVFLSLAAVVLLIWIIFEMIAFCPSFLSSFGDYIAGCCGHCKKKYLDYKQKRKELEAEKQFRVAVDQQPYPSQSQSQSQSQTQQLSQSQFISISPTAPTLEYISPTAPTLE